MPARTRGSPSSPNLPGSNSPVRSLPRPTPSTSRPPLSRSSVTVSRASWRARRRGRHVQPLHCGAHWNREERHALRRAPGADREPSARPEEAPHAAGSCLTVGLEDDPPARDGGVEAVLREVESRGVELHKLDVLEPGRGGALENIE